MVTIQAKSQYQTQHGQIILITSEFCDWQYVKSCLNENGLELSNDNHNGEMNAKLLHNALRCKGSFTASPTVEFLICTTLVMGYGLF